MNSRQIVWLVLATLVAMGIVAWLGHEYRNEAVAFLRALRRAF